MKIIYIFILFIIFIFNGNAVPVVESDYYALRNFFIDKASQALFTAMYVNEPIDMCTVQNYTLLDVKCDENGYFDSLIFKSPAPTIYTANYEALNFSKLSYIQFSVLYSVVDGTLGDQSVLETNRGIAKSVACVNCHLYDLDIIPLPTTTLRIENPDLQTKQIDFSIIQNILDFNFYNTSTAPIYNNDMISSNIKYKNSFLFSTYNIPSFESYSINTIQMKLLTGFNKSSISNLTTFGESNIITIEIVSDSIGFPNIGSSKTKELNFKGDFDTPTNSIDLSGLINLNKLTISTTSSKLNLNGQIPFINIPSTLTTLTLSKIGLTVVPDIGQTNIVNLDLSNNNLVGVLPNSFCQLNINTLNLSNNSGLVIPLPQCFICYKRTLLNTYKSIFSSSISIMNWLNTATTQGCGNITPKIQFDSESGLLSLTGDNLGFSNSLIGSYNDPQGITQSIHFNVSKYSSLYTAQWVGEYENIPSSITINFDGDDYMIATSEEKPIINTVSRKDSDLIFTGSYLQYYPNVQVTITFKNYNTTVCQVSGTSFNYIECSVDQDLYGDIPLDTNLIIDIQVGTLSTQITMDSNLDSGEIQNVTYCEKPCQNDKICLTTIGQCDCGEEWQGVDCSIPFYLCPDDCTSPLNGQCNNSTGLCDCDRNYTKSNCNTPNQYTTKFNSPNKSGGLVMIEGWFGSVHENISIEIFDNSSSPHHSCLINSITQYYINCTIGPMSSGRKNVNITQNGIVYIQMGRLSIVSDSDEKEKASWILPVAIIIPCVVVVVANIGGIIYVYKRQKINLFFEKRRKRVVSLENFNK